MLLKAPPYEDNLRASYQCLTLTKAGFFDFRSSGVNLGCVLVMMSLIMSTLLSFLKS